MGLYGNNCEFIEFKKESKKVVCDCEQKKTFVKFLILTLIKIN